MPRFRAVPRSGCVQSLKQPCYVPFLPLNSLWSLPRTDKQTRSVLRNKKPPQQSTERDTHSGNLTRLFLSVRVHLQKVLCILRKQLEEEREKAFKTPDSAWDPAMQKEERLAVGVGINEGHPRIKMTTYVMYVCVKLSSSLVCAMNID